MGEIFACNYFCQRGLGEMSLWDNQFRLFCDEEVGKWDCWQLAAGKGRVKTEVGAQSERQAASGKSQSHQA
jgi:phage terminase large subunit-like protein